MSRAAGVVLWALLAGCSSLTETGGGVAAIEVTVPFPAEVEVGSSITLTAQAFNSDGEAVDADITWQTPDATISVDAQTGVVTGIAAGTGRVQAVSGALVSELVSISVVDPPVDP